MAGPGTGDPTEIALLAAAAERGIDRRTIELDRPRRHETPFDSERKRMSVARADGFLYVKGAPEMMFPLCNAGTAGAAESNAEMARRGLRVLGVAIGSGTEEKDLRFLGLVAIADPPRSEAIAAVAAARSAGIRTVMITGDHPVTAHAIARELGIVREGEDPADRVHARATPEQKLAIVRTWKQRGAVVAMTGDGVNDAPALREAHIGIAMGRTGTEVTREASDMVLADDNFASIVAAVREGRGIFDNIRKTLVYLLTGQQRRARGHAGRGDHRPAAAAAAASPALDQPGHRRAAGAGAGDGSARWRTRSGGRRARRRSRCSGGRSGRRSWSPARSRRPSCWACSSGAARTGSTRRARSAFDTLVVSELFRAFAARSPTKTGRPGRPVHESARWWR